MKVLVIGGGMSGLTYGILCAQNKMDVTVCEQNSRVGKKLSQTGNGKCNLGNERIFEGCFNESEIAGLITQAVSVVDYVGFLRSCGIYTHADAFGRLYPVSDSAANVVDCFRHAFAFFGGKLQTDTKVNSVMRKSDGLFSVTDDLGNVCEYDVVVLSCGSGSSCIAPDMSKIVPKRYFTRLSPSLVPVKVADAEKSLDGIRARAWVTLYADGVPVANEKGEVQFKDYGLSGICVFNLSAYIARNAVRGIAADYVFSVDVVPDFAENDLAEIIRSRLNDNFPRERLFLGILHNKLAECIVKRSKNFSPQCIAHTAKNLQFSFSKLLDFSKSQVTAGGIDERFVDPVTLQLDNGIVVIGEVLNVDGLCGGYNLYFAAASAIYAFKNGIKPKFID
ncbi:MAG: aminoacetone oxidase family FAD-binding enzyme [Corallococcus sp.]|nr:aminoacetone oxidase family FAD-binding enzyme [Corallococcus sp.]MCM1359126.1 aminoacetone oxidase family FAD-binding enzyme [Corallococcus sp.]MCM1394516.1 aminoacetone oxidase family FAD-binding enzyme [Corallococcus sp.]